MTMLELVMKYGTGSTIRDKIASALPYIFNFDFPMYDNSYKSVLEAKIVKHYLSYELCKDDDEMWQLALDTWLNENMPLFNQRYATTLITIRPLVNQSLSTQKSGSSQRYEQGTNNSTVTTAEVSTSTASTENDRAHGQTAQNEHAESGSHSSNRNDSKEGSNNETLRELDTPNGGIQSLDDGYLSKAHKKNGGFSESGSGHESGGDSRKGLSTDILTGEEHNIGESSTTAGSNGSTTSTGGNSGQATTTDEWFDTVLGHAGISESKLLQEYRDVLIDIDKEIVAAIKPLFKLVF